MSNDNKASTPVVAVEIHTDDDVHIEGEKRQHFPCCATSSCPECGKEHTKDFAYDEHLCYPIYNRKFGLNFCCDDGTGDEFEGCGHEWTVFVIPRMTLEVTEE